MNLCALATKSPCKVKILGLDGDTLSMDSGKIGVLEERDEVGLSSLLEGHDSRGLEPEVGLHTISIEYSNVGELLTLKS